MNQSLSCLLNGSDCTISGFEGVFYKFVSVDLNNLSKTDALQMFFENILLLKNQLLPFIINKQKSSNSSPIQFFQ